MTRECSRGAKLRLVRVASLARTLGAQASIRRSESGEEVSLGMGRSISAPEVPSREQYAACRRQRPAEVHPLPSPYRFQGVGKTKWLAPAEAPGESQTVTFQLTAADLAFYTARSVWEAEPGEFDVFVGGSSAVAESARFTLR